MAIVTHIIVATLSVTGIVLGAVDVIVFFACITSGAYAVREIIRHQLPKEPPKITFDGPDATKTLGSSVAAIHYHAGRHRKCFIQRRELLLTLNTIRKVCEEEIPELEKL